MNSFKSVSDRKIQTLFPIVLFSIIILGSVRLVLDSFKSNQSNILGIYGKLNGENNNGVRVVVLPEDRLEEGCNVYEGKWIWDNESYPLYEEQSCPYLVKQTTCLKNGRPDFVYRNWRWQPNGCNLPRFEPLKLLDILRGKRMMFIGDSQQRGQFESMICLVQSAIPEGKKSLLQSSTHENIQN